MPLACPLSRAGTSPGLGHPRKQNDKRHQPCLDNTTDRQTAPLAKMAAMAFLRDHGFDMPDLNHGRNDIDHDIRPIGYKL